MNARHLEKRALMVHRVDLRRVAEDAALAVAQDRPVLPAAFQQFVHHLQVFIRVVVAGIVIGLRLMADIACAALQIGSDNIPANAPAGEVIERRQAAGKGIGVLKRQ